MTAAGEWGGTHARQGRADREGEAQQWEQELSSSQPVHLWRLRAGPGTVVRHGQPDLGSLTVASTRGRR
jgi:hypothetical protein